MHAKSFRIFYERVSPYGSIMCEDLSANLLIPKMGQGGGGAKQYYLYRAGRARCLDRRGVRRYSARDRTRLLSGFSAGAPRPARKLIARLSWRLAARRLGLGERRQHRQPRRAVKTGIAAQQGDGHDGMFLAWLHAVRSGE